MKQKPKISISMGDPAGIGAEILVKALANPQITQQMIPVVYASTQPLQEAVDLTKLPLRLHKITDAREAEGIPGVIDYIDVWPLGNEDWAYGKASKEAGEASFQYILAAIRDAMAGYTDAVTTGPITKEALHMAGHPFAGHTEIFAHYTDCKDFAMLLFCKDLRVIHVTTHVSMRQACDLITQKRVHKTIQLGAQALQAMGIENGRIGVSGLNPHASENGLFGEEEKLHIRPAIEQACAEGINVQGPVPPDTVFVKAIAGQYDIVVAMYHDQGHIPLKIHGFSMDPQTGRMTAVRGINMTIGLPIIRTSVDHGTAYDCAGKNVANEESLLDALLLAAQMAGAREA